MIELTGGEHEGARIKVIGVGEVAATPSTR